MAFTLSGTIITQTGTDTNLSGLSGISGVTTLQSSASGTHTTYDIGTLRLLIQGNLSINPKIENLYSSNTASSLSGSVQVDATGILNLGVKQTSGSAVKYSDGTLMAFTQFSGNQFRNPCVYINGGVLNWFGGTVFTRSPFLIAGGSTINIEAGGLYNNHTDYVQFRFESTGASDDILFNLTNLVLDGDSPIAFFTLSGFNTFAPILRNGYFQNFTGNQPDQIFVNWSNLNNFNAEDILGNNTGANNSKAVFRNVGKDIVIGENVASRDGYFRQQRAVSISPINTDASPVLDFSYYAVDSDSGNRFTSYTGEDNLSDIVYTGSETDGRLDENVVAVIGQVFNGAISYDDRRNLSGTVPFSLISYNNLITTITPDLVGLESFSQSPFMLIDSLITEQDKSIVDAYTTLDTAQQFYDRAKAYLVDNYAGETATIVTRSGETIDAGAYNVELRSGGSNAFEFDGTTISVRVGTLFTGNITTTGVVTLTGSATINGNIVDANGDSNATIILPSGVDVFTIHATRIDADSGANPLFRGTSSDSNIRYQSAIYGGQTLYVRATSTTDTDTELIATELVPTLAGNYIFDRLAFDEDIQLNAIKSVTDKLGSMLEVIAGNQVFTTTALQNAGGGSSYDDTILIAKIDVIDANIDALENYDDTVINTKLDAIPTTDSVADLTTVLDAINNLNNINAVDIRTELQVELARIDANVSSVAYDDTTLTALVNSLPTLSEMEASSLLTAVADITGLSTHDAADVVTALQVVSNDFKYDDTTLINKVDTIDTVVDSIKSKTDTLENADLTGLALTTDVTASRDTITALINGLNDLSSTDVTNSVPTTADIEAALLNEGDSQQLIDAIVQAIGNTDVDEVSLVAAIRADLEREGGMLDALPILSEIEDSSVLARASDISNLNDITAEEILTKLKPDLTIINDGVKQSSLMIPHATDLT